MNPPNERRKAYRPPFLSLAPLITCQIKVMDTSYLGILRDMSLTGLFMELDDRSKTPDISDRCEVEIALQGEHSQLTIDGVKGEVIRCDEDGVAVHFAAPMEWFAVVSGFLCSRIMQ